MDKKILVLDRPLLCGPAELSCFSISGPKHFAGVIAYSDDSFVVSCNVTVPWVAGTGKLDNETAYPEGRRCAGYNISSGDCVQIKNGCGHLVLLGCSSRELGSCYRVSNVSSYPSACTGHIVEGPSFFDRLEGKLNLSERYVNKSMARFGRKDIGLETIVDPYELIEHGLKVDTQATWVDYLYWSGVKGDVVESVCHNSSLKFRLDCWHANMFGLDTAGINASGEAPWSELLLPRNGTTVPCNSIVLSGSLNDCDGDVVSVLVGINGEWFNAELIGASWNYEWTPNATGVYEIETRATDNEGLVERSNVKSTVFVAGCAKGDNDPPPAPTLWWPDDGAAGLRNDPILYWACNDASGIREYEVAISPDPAFGSGVIIIKVAGDSYHAANLRSGKYWWRVRAQDGAGNWGNWSETREFATR